MVSREVQHIEAIKESFRAGKTIFCLADDGFFQNTLDRKTESVYSICEHCGSRYKDPEKIKVKKNTFAAYNKEKTRLEKLFKEALFLYYKLNPERPKVQKAFDIAWGRGHGSGYYEVAAEFSALVDLLDD